MFFNRKRSDTSIIKNNKELIKEQMELLQQSIELINNSNILGTVINRYKMVCNTIDNLNVYTEEELFAAGFRVKTPLSDTKTYIQKNKIEIFNQAIERNLLSEISSLKTVDAKLKKLEIVYLKIKENKSYLESDNLNFLEELYYENQKKIIDKQLESIYPEIFDLIWFEDGIYKNYTLPAKDELSINGIILTSSSGPYKDPSVISMKLPMSQPLPNSIVESPPYYPTYSGLSPEQRWKYWDFLANPFSSENDIGYAFLFYYGLERHMLSDNLDKVFKITLKLRSCYKNQSFQFYTANALFLTCISRNRFDLAKMLISSLDQDNNSTLPLNHLLILKYKFNIPLTASDIIKNHQYFGFTNKRYIKNEPELFYKVFSELLEQNFNAPSINLNNYYPMDINNLPLEQKEIFANTSLRNYKASVPIINNTKLCKKVSALLYDTHETIKKYLRYENNTKLEDIRYIKSTNFKKDTLKNMSGHDFEKYCAHLLSLNGFSSIQITKDSGDQGIDIIAYKGDTKYGIQCKLYSSHVGNSAVQEVYSGKDFYKCHIGAVLTNNRFTESAKELADSLGVLLWDSNYLYELQQADKNAK